MKYSLALTNGDAIYIIDYVANAIIECRMPKADRVAYLKNAASGDYDNLVRVSFAMIDKCNKIADDKLLYEKV